MSRISSRNKSDRGDHRQPTSFSTRSVTEISRAIKTIKLVEFTTCLTARTLMSSFHHAPIDNPNYFDVENGLASPAESRSSGIFTFRKRTSSSNKQSPPSTIGNYNNIEGKRRGSLKNLWRSRSNSASINYPKVNLDASRSQCNCNLNAFPPRNRNQRLRTRAGMQQRHPRTHLAFIQG